MKTLSLLLLAAAVQAQLTFTQSPAIQYGAGAWTITFAVSDTTDVEVTIVKASDSSIVRRLAAGKLGSNPPPPFTANSLSQTISWDGRDELGDTVDQGAALLVRVRAGMSVALDRVTGQTPYYYAKFLTTAFDPENGKLYVMGNNNALGGYNTNNKNIAIRQYNEDGTYAKTVFPCPSGRDTSEVSLWSFYMRPNLAYCPYYRVYGLPSLLLAGSWLMNTKAALPYSVENKLALFSTDTFFLVDTNGALETGKYVQRMPLAALYAFAPRSPNWYYSSALNIYRISPVTGERTIWHTFAAADSILAPGAMAFDDSGRVFICDRNRQGVFVFDTSSWTNLGYFPARTPKTIAVSPSGGNIYVLGGAGTYRVWKFRNWRAAVCVDSTAAVTPDAGETPKLFMKPRDSNAYFTITKLGLTGNVLVYRDDGDHLTLANDFSALSRDVRLGRLPSVIDRPVVDRRTETVYFFSNFTEMYKITDWALCRPVQCSLISRRPFYAGDAAISPDGYLYTRSGYNAASYSGPITKWTTDYYPAPVNYGTNITNVADSEVYGRSGDNFFGEKGIAVSRDDRVADIPIIYDTWASYNLRIIDPAMPSASRTAQLTHGVVHPLADHGAIWGNGINVPNNVGSVKFDFDGNIYISTSLTAPGHLMPPGYVMSPQADYRNVTVGGVYKFPPTGGSFTRTAAVGALTAYPQGISVFSGGMDMWGIGCACRSPRFDLDPWGRLYIPHGLGSEIAVADNNGNTILKFGGYGNADSRDIAFITPQAVAASDNFIYVADPNTPSLTRVKMDFALDNLPLPIISAEQADNALEPPRMTVWPNPGNPVTHVTVVLAKSGQTNLDVFDLRGRLVQRIHSGVLAAGSHAFTWNGRDTKGAQASAGVYVMRLSSAEGRTTVKAVLAR